MGPRALGSESTQVINSCKQEVTKWPYRVAKSKDQDVITSKYYSVKYGRVV